MIMFINLPVPKNFYDTYSLSKHQVIEFKNFYESQLCFEEFRNMMKLESPLIKSIEASINTATINFEF